jgi:hypothetical protein
VQEVDHVEAGDHGVGQLNERFRQQLSVHSGSPSARTRWLFPGGMPGKPITAAPLTRHRGPMGAPGRRRLVP